MVPLGRPLTVLVGAHAQSQAGNTLAAIAVPWLVLETTGSAGKAGIIGAGIILAFTLSGVFGGPIIDRVGLRRISVVSDALSAVTMLVISIGLLAGSLELWQIAALAFLGAFLDAPGIASRRALVSRLGGRRCSLDQANSIFQAGERMAQLLGPPLAGIIIAVASVEVAVGINGITFLISAAALWVLLKDVDVWGSTRTREVAYHDELKEGIRAIGGDNLIVLIVVVHFVTELLDGPLIPLGLPYYAQTALGSVTSLGLMVGSLGLGAVLGTVACKQLQRILTRRGVVLVCLGAVQGSFLILASVPPMFAAMVGLFAGGFGSGPINVLWHTVMQERVDPGVLGRVFGVFSAAGMAGIPIGMLMYGELLEGIGLTGTFLLVGGAYVVITVVVAMNRSFRNIDSEKATSGWGSAARPTASNWQPG